MWTEKAEESAAAEQASADAETASEDSAINPLFAIVILAVAAFLFRQKSAGGSSKKSKRASAVSADGLTGVAKYIISTTFKPIEVFIVAGSIYLLMTFIIHNFIKFLEKRLYYPK